MPRQEATSADIGQAPDSPIERLAFTIPEFCEAHRFSVAFYYILKKQGLTPDEMALGTRRLIPAESAAKWRQERTAAAASVSAATP